MFGIIIGAALTLGILKYGRYRRHHRGWGGGPSCAHRGRWEGHDTWERGGRRSSRGRTWIHGLAGRLDATHEQEGVIHGAAQELYEELRELGQRVRGTRKDLGEVFGPERFDEERMGELFATHDELLERARKAFVGAFVKIHDVLDPKQREQLARLISRNRGFGPYRA